MQSASAREDSRAARTIGQSATCPRSTTGCPEGRISERKMSASTGARSGIALLMLMRPRSVRASGRPELYRKRVAPHRTVAVRRLAGMPDGAVEQQQARRPRAHRDLGVARLLVEE